MEPTNSGVKTWQWVVTVIVIIVLIVIGVLVFGGKGTPSETPSDNTPAQNTDTTVINRIVMSDQYPGNVVYLSSVQVAKSAWVAIQTDKAGQPDKVIGSAHFEAGINPGKVTLSQSMVEGGTYYAVIYNDDGSGKFNATTAQPLKDANGNIVMHVFHAADSGGAGLKG